MTYLSGNDIKDAEITIRRLLSKDGIFLPSLKAIWKKDKFKIILSDNLYLEADCEDFIPVQTYSDKSEIPFSGAFKSDKWKYEDYAIGKYSLEELQNLTDGFPKGEIDVAWSAEWDDDGAQLLVSDFIVVYEEITDKFYWLAFQFRRKRDGEYRLIIYDNRYGKIYKWDFRDPFEHSEKLLVTDEELDRFLKSIKNRK